MTDCKLSFASVMYNSRVLICPDGLFLHIDLLFYFGEIEGISEGQFICMVDGMKLRGAKSEKGYFISIDDAIDLSLRESRNKSGYGTFRKELAVEFYRWKEAFQRGQTQFSFSDNLIVNLEVYLSQNQAGKWSSKALKIVQDTRPDLFGTTSKSQNDDEIPLLDLVYFIRGESTGHIKIGHSRNSEGRIKGFQTASSEILSIIKTIEGGEKAEKRTSQKVRPLKHSR